MTPKINNKTNNTILPDEQHQPSEIEAKTAVHNGRKISVIQKESILNTVNLKELGLNNLTDRLDRVKKFVKAGSKKNIRNYRIKKITRSIRNLFSTIKKICTKEKEEPKKELHCLVDNLMTMAKRFNGEDAEKLFDFSVGCCYGIASNFALYHKLGIPKEFHKLLLLLSKDQNSGWKFYGEKYTDISLAIEKAQSEYKKNPQTTNSDTLTLLKLRPFAESLLFFHSPETTSMHETVPTQNNTAVANILEGDMSNSEILPGSRNYTLALTQDGLTQFVTNLGQSVRKGDAGRIFHLCTGTHILSLKVNADGYELVDQNIKGFSKSFLKGSEQELSILLNQKLNMSMHQLGYRYEPIFYICEYNLTADKSKEKDFCLPEMIKKITNKEMIGSDEKNEAGMTAIHLAALNGSVEDLKRLHENHTANTNIVTEYGLTALHLASYKGHTKAVQYLLDQNYDVQKEQEGQDSLGATPLILAIEQKHTETAHLILTSNPDTADKPNKFGNTPLIYASQVNDTSIMTQLLKLEAVDVNQTSLDGLTPLCAACIAGNIEAVKLLLKHKNIKLDITREEKTPLQWAQEKGHTEVVALLEASTSAI